MAYRQCEPAPLRIAMDALFEFGSAALTGDAGAGLDALAAHLAGAQFQKVEIVGHADRIGPAKYNQQLSEARARAVRDYFVSRGLNSSKIAISGVGSSATLSTSRAGPVHS